MFSNQRYIYSIHNAYCDYILHDSTFGTNAMKLTLLPTVVVECLGKSHISSIMASPTKSSEDIIQMCKQLSILKKHTTYHTEGTAFPLVADDFQVNHKLCYHHLMPNIVSFDLIGKALVTFQEEVCELLSKPFVDQYIDKMCFLMEKYKGIFFLAFVCT